MAAAEVTSLTVVPPVPLEALAIGRAPEIVLEEAHKAAQALIQVIESKKKKVMFNGEIYLEYEDWQTVARFYGMTPIVKGTQFVQFGDEDDRVKGFAATAEVLLVATNQVISSAEALCLNDEPNWARKPLFQLKSMAQTRACAKALRNVLAWVVVLAGYRPTPAEEMQQENGGQFVAPPKRKSQPEPAEQAQELNATFVDEPEHQAPAASLTGCVKCGSSDIQPAGVSRKTNKAYKAFCRQCKTTVA